MAPEYFRALTVGNCQLPSRWTLGGSFDAMLLFARTEARVMRGIVKGDIAICSPGRKLSQLGEECALQTAQRASPQTRAKQNLFQEIREALKKFFSLLQCHTGSH
jgi:hypothetical protein